MRTVAATLFLLFSTSVLAQDADLVVRGGRIVTVDADFQIVDAMAIQNGRVVAIGTTEDIESKILQKNQASWK